MDYNELKDKIIESLKELDIEASTGKVEQWVEVTHRLSRVVKELKAFEPSELDEELVTALATSVAINSNEKLQDFSEVSKMEINFDEFLDAIISVLKVGYEIGKNMPDLLE